MGDWPNFWNDVQQDDADVTHQEGRSMDPETITPRKRGRPCGTRGSRAMRARVHEHKKRTDPLQTPAPQQSAGSADKIDVPEAAQAQASDPWVLEFLQSCPPQNLAEDRVAAAFSLPQRSADLDETAR